MKLVTIKNTLAGALDLAPLKDDLGRTLALRGNETREITEEQLGDPVIQRVMAAGWLVVAPAPPPSASIDATPVVEPPPPPPVIKTSAPPEELKMPAMPEDAVALPPPPTPSEPALAAETASSGASDSLSIPIETSVVSETPLEHEPKEPPPAPPARPGKSKR